MSLFNSLLLMIAGPRSANWPARSGILKVENETLRSKLPARIAVTPKERQRLLKFGAKLGKAISTLVTIVTPDSFLRWIPRRQTIETEVHQTGQTRSSAYSGGDSGKLIILLARKNTWGYARIVGELRKLGLRKITKSTVRNILKAEGSIPVHNARVRPGIIPHEARGQLVAVRLF